MSPTRRQFLASSSVAGAGLSAGLMRAAPILAAAAAPNVVSAASASKPAILGGTPVHSGGWQEWPVWRAEWEADVLQVLRSRKWFRPSGPFVFRFEEEYAKLHGAKACLAVSSGTTALITSLHALGVDAGDEVIVSPYTFIATYNAILAHKALPVFCDTDPATLTMDPASLAGRLTDRTRAVMPVHIFGLPCDMDPINAFARGHKLAVIEDACQAWLAEYKGRKAGTLGDAGCFSFQESKNLPSGEGGAITSMSQEVVDRCNSYHNCGRAAGTNKGNGSFTRGVNFRMQQFQAAILLQQFDKLVQETARRRESAAHLDARLAKIPGITPVRIPQGGRSAYHLYPFRYDKAAFAGLARDGFLRALSAEGIPCSSVYREQYYDGLLDEAIASRGFQRLWGAKRLKDYRASFDDLKGNKATVAGTLAFTQNMLLADRAALDHIVEAIARIQANAPAVAAKFPKS